MKLYIKSRPAASSESYSRSKEIIPQINQVHPILAHFVDDNEEKISAFLRGIKGFRPQFVIFHPWTLFFFFFSFLFFSFSFFFLTWYKI
jgi:hypothetical protein